MPNLLLTLRAMLSIIRAPKIFSGPIPKISLDPFINAPGYGSIFMLSLANDIIPNFAKSRLQFLSLSRKLFQLKQFVNCFGLVNPHLMDLDQ